MRPKKEAFVKKTVPACRRHDLSDETGPVGAKLQFNDI